MRYAAGAAWYGEENLFGPKTVYSEALAIFEFYERGDFITGHTIELILSPHVNLHVASITAKEFGK